MPRPGSALAAAQIVCLLACAPAFVGARPPDGERPRWDVGIQERFDWPTGGDVRLRLEQGDTMALSRWDAGSPPPRGAVAAGLANPVLVAGPVVGRGLIRWAADPVGFTAGSGVFVEPTAWVLDTSLRSSRTGAVVSPVAGRTGLFACRRDGETGCGAYGRIPLGPGTAAEACVLSSQAPARGCTDEWLLPDSSFPGGELSHLAGRLTLESSRFDCSFTAVGSAAQWAAPGSAAAFWIRCRSPSADGAVLLAAASPAYRSPDGGSPGDSWTCSASLGLGRDPRDGTLRARTAFSVEKPPFAPAAEIPTRTRFQLETARDFLVLPEARLSVLLEASKEVSRSCEGQRSEEARCGGCMEWMPGGLVARARAGLSEQEGVDLGAAVSLAPGARFHAVADVRAEGIATAVPTASAGISLTREQGDSTVALAVGLEDYPMGNGSRPDPARYLRFSLSTAIRASRSECRLSPTLPRE